MRSMVIRHRLVKAAALAASVALVAACGAKQPHDPSTGPSGATGPAYAAGTLLVSNGTPTVVIGGVSVTFPTTVTDATWSPDGSRIAFVDKDGNIATARPDGSGVVVLTKHKDGLVLNRPAWSESTVLYTEKGADGQTRMVKVWSNGGHSAIIDAFGDNGVTFSDAPETGNSTATTSRTIGPGREIAFQHQASSGSEVWVADTNGREPYAVKVANGTEAALSPDGSKVAFVAPDGQINVASATERTAPKPVPVTFGVATPSHLAWAPDGTRIAFQTPTDVESVAATVAAGATSNPTTQLAPASGVPTFLGRGLDQLVRVSGPDIIDAAIAASKVRWISRQTYAPIDNAGWPYGAMLANPDDLPHVLAAGRANLGGPLLFTSGSSLDQRTADELKRVFGRITPGSGPILYLVGGTDKISAKVENAVKALGFDTRRVTAIELPPDPQYTQEAFVASSADPAAVALATSTSYWGAAVLICDGTTLPAGARTVLNAMPKTAQVYAFDAKAMTALTSSWPGKPASLKPVSVAGSSGSATAASALSRLGGAPRSAVVVRGNSLADLAVGANLASSLGAALVLLDPDGSVDATLQAWLEASSGSVNSVYLIDSAQAVSNDVATRLTTWVSGPLSFTNTTAS